jgi:hypothetical protein
MSTLFSALFIAFLSIAFIVFFVIIWCLVILLISFASGWQQLAERYRSPQPISGKQWFSQYGRVNGARYGNALNLVTNAEGISLEPMILFNLNHPRIFIPWRDLHNPRPIVYRWRELTQVDVGNPSIATISLPPAVFEQGKAIMER